MISRMLVVCLLVASFGGVGCDKRSLDAREEHVLNRIGFGPDEWSRKRIRKLGVEAYIEEQLQPQRLDDSALELQLRSRYQSLSKSLAQLRATYRLLAPQPTASDVRREISRAKLLRAVHSKRQLEQVLVDFWYDHFNVDARREIGEWAVVPYERDVIRPHVLGRFEDLLAGVARHPAMLEYLDNAQNFREGFVRGRFSYGVIENYARELLELHTIGPEAGQTLSDIHDTALAFTGWTVAEDLIGQDGRGFEFVPDGHDRSAKRILRLSLPSGGGMSDGSTLLRYLARHPATAVHVSTKLCRLFVAERPTGCEVAAAARYLATDGDLREVVRTILGSQAFRDPRHFRGKIKDPFRAMVSVARATGISDDDDYAHVMSLEAMRMGQELYGAPAPDGWPDDSSAWLGEGNFLRRFNLAFSAGSGVWSFRGPAPVGTTDPERMARALGDRLLLGGLGSRTHAELVRFLGQLDEYQRLKEGTALVLSGPEFSRH
jgi:uncharacterized protein (DUF1800 family)